MGQPRPYGRTKNFTENLGSETDHSALNAELDAAGNSIADIRTNIALIQADDGKLRPAVVTPDSISAELRASLVAGVTADTVALRDAAQTSANASAASATNSANSANSAAASATTATTKAGDASTSANNAANSAASAAGSSAAAVSTLSSNLADSSDATKGTSLIGHLGGTLRTWLAGLVSLTQLAATTGATLVGHDATTLDQIFKNRTNRVVASIAALKALDKTKYTKAFVTGYYADGDGGGGAYWYDSTDTVILAAPVNAAFSTAATGGTLAAGTYWYRVTAINAVGETLASPETSITTTGTTSTAVINWGAVPGATGYRIYGRTTGAEKLMAQVGVVTTWTDTGAITPAGALPTVATTPDNGGSVIVATDGGRWKLAGTAAVSIKQFGAKGDGVTDDTASIKAAINCGRPDIYPPVGTYLVSSQITIATAIRLVGAGRNSTIFQQAANFDMFKVSGVGADGTHLEGFQITNTQAAAAVTVGSGIWLSGASWCVFNDLYILNTFNGIRSQSSPILRANAVDIRLFRGCGWLFDGGVNNFDTYVSNSVIEGRNDGTYRGDASVKLLDFCDEMTFYSCVMNMSNYAVYTSASVYGTGTRPEYCRFVACSFDSAPNGVFVDQCADMSFTSCFFSNRPGSGCSVGATNSESVTFTDSTFFNNGGNGCSVGAGAKNTVFNGCKFIGNSTVTPNAAHGLSFAPGTTDFTVTNCLFKNGWGSAGSQGYGIVINGGASTRYVITGNTFGANGLAPVSDGATGTPERYYANNIGFRTRSFGQATVLTGATTSTFNHNLAVPPQIYNLSPNQLKNGIVEYYISVISATQLTITVSPAPSANTAINWTAETLV